MIYCSQQKLFLAIFTVYVKANIAIYAINMPKISVIAKITVISSFQTFYT